MSRQLRKSASLDKADKRLSGIQSISANLNLGQGLSAATYAQEIKAVEKELDRYNKLIAELNSVQDALEAKEKALNAYSRRMLEGVMYKYGHDSAEYRQAGGTPLSAKKKRKSKTDPSAGSGSAPTTN